MTAGTAEMGGAFYAEHSDRRAGIRISTTETVARGEIVTVTGTLGTYGGERQITADHVYRFGVSGVPAPLGMCNRWIGGTSPNANIPEIKYSSGFYNAGLLVQSWGKVVEGSGTVFYLNDGSTGTKLGIRVIVPSGTTLPANDTYVRVTGISSPSSWEGGPLLGGIRVRSGSGITAIADEAFDEVEIPLWYIRYIALPGIPQDPGAEAVFKACDGDLPFDIEGNLCSSQYGCYQRSPILSWACVPGKAYRLHVDENTHMCCSLAAVTGDQLISLPCVNQPAEFWIGNPFDTGLLWSAVSVTDGYELISISTALDRGWIDDIEYFLDYDWVSIGDPTTAWMYPVSGYRITANRLNLALIIPHS